MQAKETYIGSEEFLGGRNSESKTQELQDVVARCLPTFYRQAFRQLGNAADAEDAVQDALLSAYKHLGQFERQAKMSTWVVAIVTNCARTQLRRRPRQIHLSLEEPVGDEQTYCLAELLPGHGPGPEDECRASELRGRLLRLLPRLSPALGKVFRLCALEGMSIGEAAHNLGVPDGTVKTRLSRARAQLRSLMHRTVNPKPGSEKYGSEKYGSEKYGSETASSRLSTVGIGK